MYNVVGNLLKDSISAKSKSPSMVPKEMSNGSVYNFQISATKNPNHCLAVLDKKETAYKRNAEKQPSSLKQGKNLIK